MGASRVSRAPDCYPPSIGIYDISDAVFHVKHGSHHLISQCIDLHLRHPDERDQFGDTRIGHDAWRGRSFMPARDANHFACTT
ncbi:hypothetical protein AQJ66_17290 [Streptomyces bungoensis]|uniref:Uncharacterized protein n=1 Tax=Streptomyces bungoensis TaxID=285568 RepID=A0A101T194_9ACTN|nr:hypothetical protein AQJ66_17290 [Streptomyces bungoensis]